MWYDYLIAFILGVIFVIILYFVYKFMMSLETKPHVLTGNQIVGHTGQIYLTLDKEGDVFKYIITVYNGIGTVEYPARSLNEYKVGDAVVISDYTNAYYII